MHGVIFTSLRDFVVSAYGAEVVDKVFGQDVYLLSEAYDDEQFVALLGRACEVTGSELDALLHDFGVFTAERTFTRLYPAFYGIAPSAREFILTVETRIHELVRATIPKARPPELVVTELGDDGVAIVYSSPRRLTSCFAASPRELPGITVRRRRSRRRPCIAETTAAALQFVSARQPRPSEESARRPPGG